MDKKRLNLHPGSKGWMNKYLELVEKREISVQIMHPDGWSTDAFVHAVLGKTGINFGFPSSLLFARELDESRWTTEEKLKLLLFEAHLFIYLNHTSSKPFDREEFKNTLLEFYKDHKPGSLSRMLKYVIKESKSERLETILANRVNIKLGLLDSMSWIKYVHNVFVYLDVILFHEELSGRSSSSSQEYDELAMNALNAISLASSSDGVIEAKERTMFKVFLASANMSESSRSDAEKRFKRGASFTDFTELLQKSELSKRFLIDLSCLVIFSNHDAVSEERKFLIDLTKHMGFGENELNEALALTEQFILNNHEKVPFLSDSSSLEKLYGSLSKRWIKVLGRNKDKLATELKESKELVALIRKSATTELTKEEKEAVKEQFKDIVKTMPSLAIFLLPGGAVLLPLVLKIIPDLVPSAFRDNKLEE
ncbi:MAG: LETM1 domain-containing protein [Cryomorphaceae bacterium]|jgi:hypothetical protein|nr:LETM1 domain-containing protein [Cryomorphaceae bacterium]